MKLAALIDRLDDWINPIVVKELRQAVRSRVVVILVLAFLGLQLFLVGATLMLREARTAYGDADWTAGRDVFMVIQGMLIITLTVLVPAYACVRLAAERSDQNVDLLFISTLKPHAIIAGKFFAALMIALLIFAASAPFMTFTYLLRGIDIPTILLVAGIDLLCMLFGTMFGLFLAATPGNRAVKFFTCFVGFVVLSISCLGIMSLTMGIIHFGVRGFDRTEFWLATGIILGSTLYSIGRLFFYAVAMVSPVTANRMLPVRSYFLATWVLATLATVISSNYVSATSFPIILVFWVQMVGGVFGELLLIAICEREQPGPRLARAIPRNLLLRALAFPLWTGAAGGLTFSVVLALVSMVGVFCWLLANYGTTTSPGPGWHAVNNMARVMTMILLYVYCYGMTGVLVRVHLLSGQIRSGYTFLIALLLVGLGSAIPAAIAFILTSQQGHSGQEGFWWKLPSPFWSVIEIWPSMWNGSRADDFEEVAFWFLSVWAVLVTVLSVPWYFRQVRTFHRREVKPVLVAELVAESPLSVSLSNGTAAPSDAVIAQPTTPAASVQTTG